MLGKISTVVNNDAFCVCDFIVCITYILQLNSDGVYLKTPIETTKPGSIYKETLGNLQSNTEYEITLVLSYERYADYMVPLADEMKLIVKTNMTLPGPVTVLSLECGTKM